MTTAAASSTTISTADCTIIKPIAAGVIGTLTPLQSESKTKAAAAIEAYIATLKASDAKLTSTAGKAALGSFISALEKSTTETTAQATTTLTSAIGAISTACT